jgi:type IV fimbrial biogenesis protein FimT
MSATVAQRTNELARRGFTLVELLVVLVLLAVLFTLAAPNFLTFRRNTELTSAANSFVASLSTARAEAMKRQLRAFVVPNVGNNWATGWQVFVDVDSNVTATSVVKSANDITVVEQDALPTGVSVVSSSLGDGTTAYVMFNGSGFMTKIDKTFADMSIELSNGIEGRRVIVNPNGRLRVCKPPPADTTCTESAL